MLKRIYIDNYKCFVNFELKLDQLGGEWRALDPEVVKSCAALGVRSFVVRAPCLFPGGARGRRASAARSEPSRRRRA